MSYGSDVTVKHRFRSLRHCCLTWFSDFSVECFKIASLFLFVSCRGWYSTVWVLQHDFCAQQVGFRPSFSLFMTNIRRRIGLVYREWWSTDVAMLLLFTDVILQVVKRHGLTNFCGIHLCHRAVDCLRSHYSSLSSYGTDVVSRDKDDRFRSSKMCLTALDMRCKHQCMSSDVVS